MSLKRKDGQTNRRVVTYLHGKHLRAFDNEQALEEETESAMARRLIKEALVAREERRTTGKKANFFS